LIRRQTKDEEATQKEKEKEKEKEKGEKGKRGADKRGKKNLI